MEGIITGLAVGPGVVVATVALLVFVLEGIFLGRLADLERAGKRFFWTESSPAEPELANFLPRQETLRRAA
jgi:hypothetical protein